MPLAASATVMFMGRAIFSFNASRAGSRANFIRPPKKQSSFRYPRIRSASETVADRSRARSGALRPNLEESAFRIDPNDAAASRANRFHPDLGEKKLITHQDRLMVLFQRPISDDADLERRSTHIRS